MWKKHTVVGIAPQESGPLKRTCTGRCIEEAWMSTGQATLFWYQYQDWPACVYQTEIHPPALFFKTAQEVYRQSKTSNTRMEVLWGIWNCRIEKNFDWEENMELDFNRGPERPHGVTPKCYPRRHRCAFSERCKIAIWKKTLVPCLFYSLYHRLA